MTKSNHECLNWSKLIKTNRDRTKMARTNQQGRAEEILCVCVEGGGGFIKTENINFAF